MSRLCPVRFAECDCPSDGDIVACMEIETFIEPPEVWPPAVGLGGRVLYYDGVDLIWKVLEP